MARQRLTRGAFRPGYVNETGNRQRLARGFHLNESTATSEASATLAGTFALAATPVCRLRATAALAGAGALTATARLRLPASASFAGIGALTAAPRCRFPATAAFAGIGALTAAPRCRFPATAVLAGTGALTATARLRLRALASLAPAGALTATARLRLPATGTLGVTAGLTATTLARFLTTALLSPTLALEAAASGFEHAEAALAGSLALAVQTRHIARERLVLALQGSLVGNEIQHGALPASVALAPAFALTAASNTYSHIAAQLAASLALSAGEVVSIHGVPATLAPAFHVQVSASRLVGLFARTALTGVLDREATPLTGVMQPVTELTGVVGRRF